MDKSLFRYIWQHSKRDQLIICAVVLASLPFYFMSLDLPRRIVNEAIQGRRLRAGAGDRAVPHDVLRTAALARRRNSPPLRRLRGRPCRPPVRPVGGVPRLRPDQRRLQILDQRRQGRPRRADAAADAVRPVRPGPEVHARGAPDGQVIRDGDHHQGRGRTDRRLHRRCLHHPGLPRHAGHHGLGVHRRAERLARPDGGSS